MGRSERGSERGGQVGDRAGLGSSGRDKVFPW